MEGGILSTGEKEAIKQHEASVFVSYQPKGYKDERTEIRILQNVYKKEVKNRATEKIQEFLLIQDNLAAHKTQSALKYTPRFVFVLNDFRLLSSECNTYSVFLPSNHTPFIQAIDDNVGKLFREEIYKLYDQWVDSYSKDVKLSARTIRCKLIEWTAQAGHTWNSSLAARIGIPSNIRQFLNRQDLMPRRGLECG